MSLLYKIALFIMLFSSPFVFGQKSDMRWNTFTDENIGYSIEYPAKWTHKGAKGGFICGKEPGFKNAEWSMWLSAINDSERIQFIFDYEDLYKGYKIEKTTIEINGLEALHIVITNEEKENEYIEIVHLKTEEIWFSFDNNGFKDRAFEYFYQSFKLLK